jgi:hypothetical protein
MNNYGEHGQCEATAKSTGERCKRPAVGEHGKCGLHGGKSDGPNDPEKLEGNKHAENNPGNSNPGANAVTHGLYTDENRFYREVMNDRQQRLCDQIFQDYCTQFRENNGEPHQGEQSRLFEIAVNHIKIIHSDNWAIDKPGELESGNPMVDKGERYNTEGVPYQEYSETVVLQGQTKLRNSDRQWLKDYNLLYDSSDGIAGLEDGQTIAEILSDA